MSRKCWKDEKGFLLVASLLIISVLEIFSLALFSRSNVFIQASERHQNKMMAFNMAEAGLDQAIIQLQSNQDYAGVAYTGMDTTGTITSGGSNVNYNVQGGYSTTVTTPAANYRLITATGSAPGSVNTATAYEVRTVQAYAEIDTTPFEYAVFGDTSVTLNGGSGLIDSYNSGNGAYGGANILSNGDIASDGTITNNNTTVNGDVVTNPDINCSPGSTTLTSQGSINISGNTTLTLPGGTYHYSSISVSGNARIVTTGPVTIYVDGAVSIGGNGVTTAGNVPANFSIIATDDEPISVSGNGDFYGTIYAPSSTVTSNAGNYYGAVISKTFTQNGNGNVHFDEALAGVPAPCVDVDMKAWTETNTAAATY